MCCMCHAQRMGRLFSHICPLILSNETNQPINIAPGACLHLILIKRISLTIGGFQTYLLNHVNAPLSLDSLSSLAVPFKHYQFGEVGFPGDDQLSRACRFAMRLQWCNSSDGGVQQYPGSHHMCVIYSTLGPATLPSQSSPAAMLCGSMWRAMPNISSCCHTSGMVFSRSCRQVPRFKLLTNVHAGLFSIHNVAGDCTCACFPIKLLADNEFPNRMPLTAHHGSMHAPWQRLNPLVQLLLQVSVSTGAPHPAPGG